MSNRIKESNITPGAVTSDKIAPGTISASNISPGTITGTQIAPATITAPNIGPAAVGASNIAPGAITTTQISPTAGIVSGQIAPGTIANDRLANTGITINGTTIALGASGEIVAGTDWQSVFVGDGSTELTTVAGEGYFIDTTSGAVTVNLPSSPSAGDTIVLKDYARTWATNNVTLASALMDGATDTNIFNTSGQTATLVYMDGTKGWSLINEDTTSKLENPPTFVAATGGTVTTSGDYKVHVFTGDGCFSVSQLGNSPTVPTGGPNSVDYLVVAGGGGGAGAASGGGGAGGFRVSNSYGLPAPTMSPLATPTGITVSTTNYPITVGAGGVGTSNPACGGAGSPSIFSTITSAGGGGAARAGSNFAGSGGSGGGGGGEGTRPGGVGGSGNTPPTSPPQGNNGGDGGIGSPCRQGAGGGGAGAVGASAPSVGNGGVGSYLSPSFAVDCVGTPGPVPGVRYFAGGGGGGFEAFCGSNGAGGAGGGGRAGPEPGSPDAGNGTPGTANTGGGAGGGSRGTPGTNLSQTGGNGGKGIVIIRYKFQN